MPITPEIILRSEGRIRFQKPGEAIVLVGPCTGRKWTGNKITMDGRHYECAGTVILKNGKRLFASLPIKTHNFDFLEQDGVYCQLGDSWYKPSEPEFLVNLGISAEEAFPYTWLSDIPLDYHVPGPYPMDWFASIKADRKEDSAT